MVVYLNDKLKRVLLLREKRIRAARKSFWEFCKVMHPTFYKDDRWHLKHIADSLQALYEGRLLKKDGTPYTKIIISVPPRMGKTFSKDNFIAWCLGRNPHKQKIISASYSKALSIISSRNIRNSLSGEKRTPFDITYQDIFPETRLSDDNAGVEQWSLDGSFFTYKATSVGSSVTGMGTNLAVIDDLVADSLTANNENELDKIYSWFTDTFLSRMESGSIMILIGTKWSSKDHIGRILSSEEAEDYFTIELPAYDKEKDEMLCSDLLSYEQYKYLERNIDEGIFLANYMATTIDSRNKLYNNLQTYDVAPMDFDHLISYTDTADCGSDYLCSIVAGVKDGQGYILDVLFTQEPFEKTEPLTVDLFYRNRVRLAKIESNSGGRQFSRNIERLLWETYRSRSTIIQPFHQSQNKMARILTNATFVQNHIFFPHDWKARFPEFYKQITQFQRNKNKFDDAADALTGIAEMLASGQFNQTGGTLNKSSLFRR